MTKPEAIQKAILALWITIGASALLALVDRWLGYKSVPEFSIEILIYGAMCIIPYKISNGSNAARYVYAVMMAISVLVYLGLPATPASLINKVGSFVLELVGFLTLYWLFAAESGDWFKGDYQRQDGVRIEPTLGSSDSENPFRR